MASTTQKCARLVSGTDYTVTMTAGGGFQVDFTAVGIAKLEEARRLDPEARMSVGFKTTVLADGNNTVTLTLYPSAEAIAGGAASQVVEDSATTKWGPVEIHVHKTGKPDGWEGVAGPLPLVVESTVIADIAVVELKPSTPGPTPSPPSGSGDLPTTGAQVGSLAMLSLAVTALGVALLRRRRDERVGPGA